MCIVIYKLFSHISERAFQSNPEIDLTGPGKSILANGHYSLFLFLKYNKGLSVFTNHRFVRPQARILRGVLNCEKEKRTPPNQLVENENQAARYRVRIGQSTQK